MLLDLQLLRLVALVALSDESRTTDCRLCHGNPQQGNGT
jgi:hypothetical protein